MQCPKCEYVRTESDVGPEYECPKCGIIYAKFNPDAKARTDALRAKKTNQASNHQDSMLMIKITKIYSGLFELIKRNKFAKISFYFLGGILLINIGEKIFGPELAIISLLSISSFFIVTHAAEVSRQKQEERNAAFEKLPYQHCLTCGHDFKHKGAALRGNNAIEIALWVCLAWPIAIVYSIWRRLGAGKAKIVCLVCASDQVVPENSPAAIAHKRALEKSAD